MIAVATDGFVGRREELAYLREACAGASTTHSRFVLVEGEAGVGKSRLLAEFVASAAGAAVVARGDCSEHVRNPYGPLWPIFERVGAKDVRRSLPELAHRPSAVRKAAFFDSAVLALARAAARRPIVAIVEDLQWADSATLELLSYLVQNLRDARLLLVAALRTDDATVAGPVANFRHFASRQGAVSVRLRGLRRNEIRALIVHRLGACAASVPPDTIVRIEALSEGNPLYAEELARIAGESGGLNLATHAPLSLQATLGERSAFLRDEEREILVRAAICGRRFRADFLSTVLDEPLQNVLRVIQRAVTAGILIGVASDPLEFLFRHAMFRQAFADQMILGLAAPLHVRIAREIESYDDAGEHVAELAYHWSEARVADRARYYNERAAESAWNVFAYRDAIGFYGTALRWDYPPGRDRAALCERLATLLYIEGCGEEPTQWFERSRTEYAAAGDMASASRALLRLADQYWVDARTTDSYAAAAEAAAATEELGETAIRAEALLSLARYAITLGAPELAQRHLHAAETMGSAFDVALRACFHEVRAEIQAACGRAPEALADCRDATRLAHEAASSELIAQVENNCALVACDLGELPVALQRHAVALEEARRTSMNWRVAYCALNYAHALTLGGEFQRARELAWEALESGVTTATFKTKAAAVGIPLALALSDRRLLDACADDAALAFAVRSGEPQRIASVSAAFAELRLAQGAHAEARALLERAFDAMARPHRCVGLLVSAAAYGQDSISQQATRLLSRAKLRPRVRRACRLLIQTLGAHDDARSRHRLAAVAAAACDRTGWKLYRARCIAPATEGTAAKPISPRQLEIARLVAEGETNRAIAHRLHISEHTVEHHLSTIFARLGLRSRSALAAYVERSLQEAL